MGDLNEIENLERQLSNLSTLSESHKITKHSMKWVISQTDIQKNITIVGGYIESKWIYKEDVKYYYLIFYPNGQDDSSKGLTSIKIVFYEKISENASIEGDMLIKGRELNVTKQFKVKSFTKEHVVDFIDTEFLRIHAAQNDLIIHCSIMHNIHYVECEFDDKKVFSKKNENFHDNFKRIANLSDVTLNFQNNVSCRASKALLVKVPYFQRLFDEHDGDSVDMTNFNNIQSHTFDEFLRYLYTDYLPVLDFNLACELYALAHSFEFSELKSLCYTYLSASLTTKNVLILLKIAFKCCDVDLKMQCFQFIKESDPLILSTEAVW